MKRRYVFSAILFAVAFVTSAVWEFAQMPLYTEGGLPFREHAPMCLWASVWDAGYVLVLYLFLALFNHDFLWIRSLARWQNLFLIVGIGLATATFVELRALERGNWSYAPMMPLVPYIGTGLTPFIQLPITAFLAYLFAREYTKKIKDADDV